MFTGKSTRGRYARAALIRIGLFITATAAYPFLAYAIMLASNCRSVGGACGAVGLVVALYVKPTIYLIFILSFIGITIKRLRDLRLPIALAAAVPLLMLADFSFGMTIGAPWSLAFVVGAMGGWPRHLIMALICIVFLCFVPTEESDEGKGRTWGYAGAIALGFIVVLCIGAILSMVQGISIWVAGMSGIRFTQVFMRSYALYGMPALLAGLLAWIAWRRRTIAEPTAAEK